MAKKKLVIPPIANNKAKTIGVSTSKAPASTPQLPPGYKEGAKWPYFSTEPNQEDISKAQITKNDRTIVISLFILSIGLKLGGLSRPDTVVFDESHTIKHINKYIDGIYFNGISPPLSSLFYTLIAYLSGYRGGANSLEIAGQSYVGSEFPYANLRFITVLVSSLTVPLLFVTLRSSGVRTYISGATSLLLVLENSIVTHSRLFLPDTLFLFGLSLVVYGYKKFDISKPFSLDWFRLLLVTAIGLGLTISTKWIGVATISWIILLTAIKVWYLLGDVSVSDCQVTKHVGLRSIGFVVIPLFVYLSTFFVHILLLKNFHNDASLLSPDLQRTLEYNDISKIPTYVTFGSTVTIRHKESIGGYLHSHPYPSKSGSRNQQVTVYDYKDLNNEWIIEPARYYNKTDPRIRSGSEFRLRHKLTGALLTVDKNFKPPISEQEYDSEVSCVGNSTFEGGFEQQYKIIFDDNNGQDYLKTFDSLFHLQNLDRSCFLLSHDLKLPDWGFNQQEVLCIENPTKSRADFYIEFVRYPEDFEIVEGTPLAETIPIRNPSFLSKALELNLKGLRLLRNIKSSNPSVSSALSWPFLFNGMNYTTGSDYLLYVIGNPVIYWLVLFLIPTFVLIKALDLFKTDFVKESVQFKTQALTFVLGWFLHLLPYLVNEGEFFLLYYIPSLYFGILLIGVTFEFLVFRRERVGYVIIGVTLILSIYFYSSLLPLTFSTEWTEVDCLAAKIVPFWDFNCDIYKKATN